jgi:hypothetical protein
VTDFRTLYYPWRGSGTGITQRRVLVDRHEITRRNQLHLTRAQVKEPELAPELGYLHLTLGHLNQLKLCDATRPHLAHPTLGELYPTFGALGGDDAPHRSVVLITNSLVECAMEPHSTGFRIIERKFANPQLRLSLSLASARDLI